MKAKVKSKLNLENRNKLEDVIPLKTPYLLYLDPSSLCNFKCEFCPSGHKHLVDNAGYKRSIMDFDLFKKIIDDLDEFENPIKVLRMNKIGEPLMNKKIVEMVDYAKKSGRVEYIDFATNGGLFDREIMKGLIDAKIDRINFSVEGMNAQHYKKYCKVDFDFDKFVENIKWLYSNKGNCEIVIKIPSNYLTEQEKKDFYETFGNYCDRIFIENLTSIWPGFEITDYCDIPIEETSQYGEDQVDKDVCSYIFYTLVVNADGTVSACCPDWEQKLIWGDTKTQSLKEIWNSKILRDFQIQHLKGDRVKNETCGQCKHIKFCQVDNIDPHKDKILKQMGVVNV